MDYDDGVLNRNPTFSPRLCSEFGFIPCVHMPTRGYLKEDDDEDPIDGLSGYLTDGRRRWQMRRSEEHPAPELDLLKGIYFLQPLEHAPSCRRGLRHTEVAINLAIPTPLPSPLSPWSSPLPQIPSPPLPVSPPLLVSSPPLPVSPT
ncbi:hypothetical protein Tco_0469693 [Tanacetum coccineum]